jgi:DNA-binding LytR/AlgR family response regulator
MNLTCYIVDDEFHAVEILSRYVEKTPGLELVGYSSDPLYALNQVANDPPDVTFLDVDMPDLSGMEFAVLVNMFTKIIFTTSFPEFAIEAFDKEAFDYLLKPIGYERFLKTIMKLKRKKKENELLTNSPRQFFFIQSDVKGRMIKIFNKDILYIESAQNYIKVNTRQGNHMAYLTMGEVENYLPKEHFSRVHRGFIINNDFVKTVEHGQVIMDDETSIVLGGHYKEPFLELMKQQLIQSKRRA